MAPLGERCGMNSQLRFGQFICGYTKELTAMFTRMVEETILDMQDCFLIMLDIQHKLN